MSVSLQVSSSGGEPPMLGAAVDSESRTLFLEGKVHSLFPHGSILERH